MQRLPGCATCRWSERYDRRFEDLFDVLDEITDVVVATIEPDVGYAERDRVSRRSRTDLRAWDLYPLGIAHFFRFTSDDNVEAQQLLAEARRIDPDFADAHARWAYSLVLGTAYWETEPIHHPPRRSDRDHHGRVHCTPPGSDAHPHSQPTARRSDSQV